MSCSVSALSCLSFVFLASSFRSSFASETSMPPYFDFQRWKHCTDMPCSRTRSSTLAPALWSLKMIMIYSSLYHLPYMSRPPSNQWYGKSLTETDYAGKGTVNVTQTSRYKLVCSDRQIWGDCCRQGTETKQRNSSLSFLKSTGGGQFGEEDEQLIEAGPGRPPVASATAVAQYMHTVTVHHWKLY